MIGTDWKEENILEVPANGKLTFIDYQVPSGYVLFIDEIIFRIDKLCQAILNVDNNIRLHPNLIRALPVRVNQSAYPPIVCEKFVHVEIINTDTKPRWNEAYLGGRLFQINQLSEEQIKETIPEEEFEETEFDIEEIE